MRSDTIPPMSRGTPSILSSASALLSSKLLKNGTLKVYEKFPHGMCTTHAEAVNPDLLAFIRS